MNIIIMLASHRGCLPFATSRLWLRHRRQLYLHKTTSNFSCHMHYVYTHAFTLHPSFCFPPHCFFIPISDSNYVLVYCQHATSGVLINILTLSRNYSFVLAIHLVYNIILYGFCPFIIIALNFSPGEYEGLAKWRRVCAKVDGNTGGGGYGREDIRNRSLVLNTAVARVGWAEIMMGQRWNSVIQHYCTTRAIINTIHDGNKQE